MVADVVLVDLHRAPTLRTSAMLTAATAAIIVSTSSEPFDLSGPPVAVCVVSS